MFKVSKRLDFCYGHRLMNYSGKCARPHGHNAVVEIELEGEAVNELGMVCDFEDVEEVVWSYIERNLDHRMILREDDPLVGALRDCQEEPFLMKENPTAENLTKLIFTEARACGLPAVAVRLWETPDAYAEYRIKEDGG